MIEFLTPIVVAITVGGILYVAVDRFSLFPLILILTVAIYIVSRVSETLIKKYSKENSQ